MKKLFTLALLAIFGMGSASADEVTMKYSVTTTTNMKADGTNEAATFGLDESKWEVTADKGGSSNAPGLNKAGDIRLYWASDGGNTITVKSLEGATINKITVTFNTGKDNLSVKVGNNTITGEGGVFNINSSSFVLGNANTSNIQVQMKSIVIDYSANTSDTRTATTIEFSGDYETRATCGKDESVNLPTATVKAGDAAVTGATVTWESSNTEIATISGNKVNIANGTQGEVKLTASYAGDNTYKESSKSYTLKVYKGYGLFSSMIADVTSGNEKWATGEMVSFWNLTSTDPITYGKALVTYVNGSNTYITDGTNNMMLYGNNLGLAKGDIITSEGADAIYGKLKLYNGLPEIEVDALATKVVSQNNEVTAKTITADKLAENINAYVKIENAEFVSASKKNLTFKVGETDLAVYNQFSVDVATLEATAKYTLTGMGSVYNTTYQLYLISFEKTGEPTAINEVKANTLQNGAVYNVAGQQVTNGYKGLVIKNGKKVVNK